jgi:hypothetical protein
MISEPQATHRDRWRATHLSVKFSAAAFDRFFQYPNEVKSGYKSYMNILQLARRPLSPETLSRVSDDVHRPPQRGVQLEPPGARGLRRHDPFSLVGIAERSAQNSGIDGWSVGRRRGRYRPASA